MNLIKKLIAIVIALILMLSLVGCGGKTTEIPNVFGVNFNDATEILEAEGFEVNAIETNVKSISEKLLYPLETVEKGSVFKIDDYILDGNGYINLNYNILHDEEAVLNSSDKSVVIYYAKEDYSGTDETEIDEEATTKQTKKQTTTKDKTTKAESSADWREFLADYEAWVDDYVEICKKYKDNPTDMSILSDYTEMMTELTEWTKKTEDMELSIADTDEALEYSQELLRIAGKMAEVAE